MIKSLYVTSKPRTVRLGCDPNKSDLTYIKKPSKMSVEFVKGKKKYDIDISMEWLEGAILFTLEELKKV